MGTDLARHDDLGNDVATTIPLLPAISLEESLSFYEVLGFEVTLRQKAPSSYGVVRFRDFELHLFGLRELQPDQNFTTCLVVVPEIEDLHTTFRVPLEAHLGRQAYRGLPRLSRVRPGQTRFTVTDVAGNSIIFVRRGGQDDEAASAYRQAGLGRLQRAVLLAERERDFKTDDAGAASRFDAIIERYAGDVSPDYLRAVEARLELAILYDEDARARTLREMLATLT
jgi:hypothetical protein